MRSKQFGFDDLSEIKLQRFFRLLRFFIPASGTLNERMMKFRGCMVLFAASLCVSSCAMFSQGEPEPEAATLKVPVKAKLAGTSISRRAHPRPGRLGPAGGVLGLEDRFVYPEISLVRHPEVTNFVRYYTEVKRSYVNEALDRRARFKPVIEEVMARYGLPKELSNIAFIESRFTPDARCRDGSTVGMWQLSRRTAQNYGLKVNGKIDERKDVKKSTEAAARFLASLYDSFGDWYLAAAAYNAGPVRVQRALDKAGASSPVDRLDFFELTSRGILSETTREFVAKFGALVIITRDMHRYGFYEPDSPVVKTPEQQETCAVGSDKEGGRADPKKE